MDPQFRWLDVRTEYREARPSKHGEELRWIVTRETILNTATGDTVTRGTIRHPGICVIVPLLDEDRILLMHQYRYAADERLWELPAGTLEGRLQGDRVVGAETPVACAARELQEETGYKAGKLEHLFTLFPSPGILDEKMHIFIATDLTPSKQKLDDDEEITIKPFTFKELRVQLKANNIKDGKTIAALSYMMVFKPYLGA